MTTATETQPTTKFNRHAAATKLFFDCGHAELKPLDAIEYRHVSVAGPCTTCRQAASSSGITLSNFRVEYRAPRYEDGKVLYDGYCAILADDAEFEGRTVRVFDVPDADEGQRAVAEFACAAMNAHERLKSALEQVRVMFFEDARAGANVVDGKLVFADNELHPWIPGARAPKAIAIIDDALATTTSK